MSQKTDQLEKQIDNLLQQVKRDGAAIAEGVTNTDRLRRELARLKLQGREAVFNLMLHSPHRQFMKFLKNHE